MREAAAIENPVQRVRQLEKLVAIQRRLLSRAQQLDADALGDGVVNDNDDDDDAEGEEYADEYDARDGDDEQDDLLDADEQEFDEHDEYIEENNYDDDTIDDDEENAYNAQYNGDYQPSPQERDEQHRYEQQAYHQRMFHTQHQQQQAAPHRAYAAPDPQAYDTEHNELLHRLQLLEQQHVQSVQRLAERRGNSKASPRQQYMSLKNDMAPKERTPELARRSTPRTRRRSRVIYFVNIIKLLQCLFDSL